MGSVHGLEPVSAPSSVVLVLGTMPGQDSLALRQYYAHSRNAFWRIVGDVLHIDTELDYATRVERLIAARVAVWDVLEKCTRAGSLDADIKDEVPNDFAKFFDEHPKIAHVYFNGRKAEKLFRKHVLTTLQPARKLSFECVPSSSSAYALKYEKKIAMWKAIAP